MSKKVIGTLVWFKLLAMQILRLGGNNLEEEAKRRTQLDWAAFRIALP